MIGFVGAASDLVDGVAPKAVKVVVFVVMSPEIVSVVVVDFVVLMVDSVVVIVDFVVLIVDSVVVIVESVIVVIDCVVVVVDFVFDVVDSMAVVDCIARHPRSKNEQINLIM